MQLKKDTASIYIPDGMAEGPAIARTTHLGIGAHQDDLEFMAYHGILECFHSDSLWFGGVTCTNGGGSARTGKYERFSDEDMMGVRRKEQDVAAHVGHFSFMAQIDHPSSSIKDPANSDVADDLTVLLEAAQPEVVYTHNPADKHATHIGVVVSALQAVRNLPAEKRPKKMYGCEVWRDLDWMPDDAKVVLDVSGHENLAAALNGVFDSQIAGGKRYDLAVQGRRLANATFFASHATDEAEQIWFAMDLTPLVQDDSLDLVDYVGQYLDRFAEDVRTGLSQRLGK
jgi:LmbE family N-acetylglucosaminyl deacetylase